MCMLTNQNASSMDQHNSGSMTYLYNRVPWLSANNWSLIPCSNVVDVIYKATSWVRDELEHSLVNRIATCFTPQYSCHPGLFPGHHWQLPTQNWPTLTGHLYYNLQCHTLGLHSMCDFICYAYAGSVLLGATCLRHVICHMFAAYERSHLICTETMWCCMLRLCGIRQVWHNTFAASEMSHVTSMWHTWSHMLC
jgi:hypothetical protein